MGTMDSSCSRRRAITRPTFCREFSPTHIRNSHIHEMNYILKVLNGEMTMEEYPIQKDEVMNVVAIIEAFYKSAQLGREVTAQELDR